MKEENSRKLKSKRRYFYALVLAIFLFFFGFFVVQGITAFEFERTSVLQENIFYDFYKHKLDHEFFYGEHCSDFTFEELDAVLNFQGSMISDFEDSFGKDNEYVLKRKSYYYLLQLSHFNEMKKLNEECGWEKNFILFFYSNADENLDSSVRVGELLSYYRNNNPSVLVYSFDINAEDELVKKLIKKYEITGPLTILINENFKLNNLENVKELDEFF